jgi:TIR domain
MFAYDIFLSHAAKDAERVDEVIQALEKAGYRVYCDRRDDPQLDRTHVNRDTADVLRERMRSCRMLLFVATASSARSVWMPWELGFFDAARGNIVVYPVDEAAEAAARNQQYLSLYEVIPAGSLEREIAERLQGAVGVEAAMQEAARNPVAIEALQKYAVDNLFGPGDHRGSVQHGERIAGVTRGPTKLDDVLRLQSDLATAWWHVWMGMLGGKR